MGSDKAEKNKSVVDQFFKIVMHESENPDYDRMDEFVREDYIQHNGMAGQGRAGLRNFLQNVAPNLGAVDVFKSPLIKINLIADGDLVVRQEIRKDWTLVDIFRLEDFMLAEHWEAWHFEESFPRPTAFKS